MRAIWSGSINFGLVNIPVRLYPATEDKNLDFDYLHNKDLSRVRYAKICEKEEKEIEYKELVRGFKLEDESYVVVTDEDLKRAAPEKSESIQILSFAKEDQIDSKYFETPYYIEPSKGASKAYYLLHEALETSGTVGVASFILRTRETLGILKTQGGLIVLNRVRYQEEIRDSKELSIPSREQISKAEIDMATTLIKRLTKKFDPSDYHDTYREKLEKLIKAKSKGAKLPEIKTPKPSGKTRDLMELLKESLNEGSAAA